MQYIVKLRGHIDTSSAPDADRYIERELAKLESKPDELILDCEELEYISSTGLRIILKYKKQFPKLQVTNVSNDIYSVFDMTGFTRIIDVKKALRKIDLDECIKLGEGGNGAVYRVNDEEIVKVSKHSNGDEALIYEKEKVKEAFLLGMPTVISFDTVDCGKGRKGIVMEALDSHSLGSYLSENPARMKDLMPKYVDLFRQTNAIQTDSPFFHNIKEHLRSCLYMPNRIINDEEAEVLSSILDEIPDCNNLVHFDGHVGNVLMYGTKDDRNLMLIDLGDTGVGHPILDIVAIAFIMMEPEYGEGCTMSGRISGMGFKLRDDFFRQFIAELFHVTDQEELDRLTEQAGLLGRIKSAFIMQRWYSEIENEKFRSFGLRLVKETLALAPEIRAAIRTIVQLYK